MLELKSIRAGYGTFQALFDVSLEVRAALQADPENRTRVVSRVYGLGGKDFYAADAAEFFSPAAEAARTGTVATPLAYHGATPGVPGRGPKPGLPPITAAQTGGTAHVQRDDATGRLHVELEPMWKMTSVPSRIAPGHGACPGCGRAVTPGFSLEGWASPWRNSRVPSVESPSTKMISV